MIRPSKNSKTSDGFTAISNSIYQQLLQRDFTKRQLSVLLMILRLSYGCQRSNAYIPKLVSFGLCGVGKTNITEVLNSLVKHKVLFWDKRESTFEINQNVQDWDIEKVGSWEDEGFQKLLRQNLERSSQNDNFLEPTSNQNENSTIIEMITENSEQLSNQLLGSPMKPHGSKGEDASKDSIKEIKKDIAVSEALTYEAVEREYCSLHGKRNMSAKDRKMLGVIAAQGIPAHFIVQRMKETFAKKIERDEKINSFVYYERPILDSWQTHSALTLSVSSVSSEGKEQQNRYQSRQERQNEMLLRAIREEPDDKDGT